MAFEIKRLYSRPADRYPYNCRVTFGSFKDAHTAKTWTLESKIPCSWIGEILYIGDRYAAFLALKYANAAYD